MPLLSSDNGLHLMLLGGFDARLNGLPVAGFAYKKMRALLAYLAVKREQEHDRKFLIELLWNGLPPAAAQNNLRRALSDLRRALELPTGIVLLSNGKHTIRFIPNLYVDVLDFSAEATLDQMERQVALYRGEFMAEFTLPDCPEFENWLQIQREAMHRRALALLEQLSNCYEQADEYANALPFAQRYTELEPWNEDAHRRVMRLCALNGQVGVAISQYDACCRLLKNGLGALPCEETRLLAERIRRGELQRKSFDKFETNGIHRTNPQGQAERRQVTVLYCELSTTGIDDTDEAMELLRAPQARCGEIIGQFSGHIVQTHGGGLLAYFGYPTAHEDAARHAVQAALAITLEAAHGIEIRVGAHTGMIITSGNASIPDTVGKTSRLAIQLCQSAALGGVAISQETYSLIDGYFDCESLGVQSATGYAREMHSVVGASGARTRLDAAAQLTLLIGREAEIAQLAQLWDEVARGMSHVVLIQGEAGIGKSRLLHALTEQLKSRAHVIYEMRCFPEYSQSPFHPVIAMFEPLFGFEQADTDEVKSGKLAHYLEAHHPALAKEALPLLSLVHSLPVAKPYHAPALTPQKQKEQTLAILLAILQSLAARQPVLLILEDLHWIDPSTLELLTRFVEQKRSVPILAVLTARPEFDPPWNEAFESMLTLAPLDKTEVAQMVASISPDIPAAMCHRIMERADGVPLFVEEMAKLASLDNQAAIPATLHDLLAARMDRLGEAKYTAQLAATIGRKFDLDLLRRVSPCDSNVLARALSSLQDEGLILSANKTNLQFKHALIQEAAYQSQTKPNRQAAHGRIAQTLQADFPEIIATNPELLAQHFAAAGKSRQAIEYWLSAAQRASSQYADAEAVEHLTAGLQALSDLPDGIEKNRLEFSLQVRLGFSLQTLSESLQAPQGFNTDAVVRAFRIAMELSKTIGDAPGLFQALHGLCFATFSHPYFDNSAGLALARQLLNMAQESGDPLQLQQAHYALGYIHYWIGNFSASRLHHEQCIALDPLIPQDIYTDVSDRISGVFSLAYLSYIMWLQGATEQAQTTSQLSIQRARQFAHPNTLRGTLAFAANLQCWLGNKEAALALIEEGFLLAREIYFPIWLVAHTMQQGWVLSMQGKVQGLVQLRQCADQMHAATNCVIIAFTVPLADALLHHGKAEESLVVLNESLAEVVRKNDHHFEAELHRLKGESLLALSPTNTEQACACFSRALEVSKQQGAKSLELRAAISTVRLWQQQGRQEEGRRLLEEIYDWFTEGFNTTDLKDAARLLHRN